MIRKPEQKERPVRGEPRRDRPRIEPPRIPAPHVPMARPIQSDNRPSRSRFGETTGKRPSSNAPREGGRPARRTGAPQGTTPIRRKTDTTHEITPERDRNSDKLRFIPLGGMEEIGRNCSFFEYGNEIIVIDAGIQFPEEETPGIDYIIPNVTYLAARKGHVRGIILTHGHYDHIAAIHYLIEKLGNPIIYTSAFTKAIVEKRHEEFTNVPKLRFEIVKDGSTVRISEHMSAQFFGVGHTIPESLGFVLETPVGKMASCGDFRLETNKKGEPEDLGIFERLGEMGIHSFFMDATNAEFPGFTLSERIVEEEIETLIKGAKGRVIVGAFASLVDRLLEIIKIADKLGRKVAVNGRSMVSNLDTAKNLGYLKERSENMIRMEDINKYKDEKLLVLTTGSQGEANAGLMRIVNGEHRLMKLKPTDIVIFSSSVVPGNERSVQTLQDNIARQVDEVYNSKLLDIHSSGHAKGEDVKTVLTLVHPKFVVPIHSYYYKRKAVIKLAETIGIKRERVIMMDNGQVAELTKDDFKITKETVPAFYVMVDGLGVGDVEEVVLRDRRALAQEGMIVVIITMDRDKGKLLKSPDIISRGFIYLKENQEILEEMRKRIRGLMDRLPHNEPIESDYLKTLIRDQLGQFLYSKTRRRPMILPVVIEI